MNLLYHWVGFIIIWANICIALIMACWAIYTAAKLSFYKWYGLQALYQQYSSQEEHLQLDSLEMQPEHS